MAKKSAVNRNEMVKRLVKQYASKRDALTAIANDDNRPLEERFDARLKLAKLPRNSSKTRIRNRCEVTGRPRAFYRKLKMSRIALRELGSHGQIPGLVKSTWLGGSNGCERRGRRDDRSHSRRRHARPLEGAEPRLQAARARPRRAARRRLHP